MKTKPLQIIRATTNLKKRFTKKLSAIVLVCLTFIFIAAGLVNNLVDWTTPPAGHLVSPLQSEIVWGPVKTVRAFFPAEANLQWLSSVSGYTHEVGGTGTMQTHPGASTVQSGALNCKSCHEAGLSGGTWAAGLVNSPTGIPGKQAYKDIDIQAAFDSSYLYVKASWATQQPRPGISHQFWHYSSGVWTKSIFKDDALNDPDSLPPGQIFSCEDRLAVQVVPKNIGDTLKAFGSTGMTFNQAGCFIACHSSMRHMPESPSSTAVKADPWLGDAGIKAKDLRHYLLYTRNVNSYADANSTGNWQTTASGYNASQRDAGYNASKFIDLWQWRAARSGAMYVSGNDAIMEFRNFGAANTNQGDNPFWGQDPATAQPANVNDLWYDSTAQEWKDSSNANAVVSVASYDWMYDSTITGFYAFPYTMVDAATGLPNLNWTIKFPLITKGPDRNAIPLDSTKIKDGDWIPLQPLRYATGIRGMLNAFSSWDQSTGKWTVIFRRKLNQTKCDHGAFGTYCSDHNITYADLDSTGQGLTMAFGVFDDNAEVRFHHVSFPVTLREGSSADIIANNLTTGIEPVEGSIYSIGQNYPNPFAETTQIRYTLTKGEKVNIQIHDITGRVVKTLLNEYKNAGIHTISWNAQELETGIYFYSLQAGEHKEMKKALLVK